MCFVPVFETVHLSLAPKVTDLIDRDGVITLAYDVQLVCIGIIF